MKSSLIKVVTVFVACIFAVSLLFFSEAVSYEFENTLFPPGQGEHFDDDHFDDPTTGTSADAMSWIDTSQLTGDQPELIWVRCRFTVGNGWEDAHIVTWRSVANNMYWWNVEFAEEDNIVEQEVQTGAGLGGSAYFYYLAD